MNARHLILLTAALCACTPSISALDSGFKDVVVLDAGTSPDAGSVIDWPFGFAPNIAVTVDPTVQGGSETCAFTCSNSRQMLPRVLNACELGGVLASASGDCVGGQCQSGERCVADEFQFAQQYCAKSGRPRAYCWASRNADGLVTLSERVLHRLTGSIVVIRLRDEGDRLVAQAFTQEGTDMLDDQGRPWPLPIGLLPTSGSVTLASSDLQRGATVRGRYHLEFELPNVGPVIVDGTFSDTIR